MSSSSSSSSLPLPNRGPPRDPLLPEGANPLVEILPGKHLIPHLAGDGAGLPPTEPPHPLDKGHPGLDSRRTEFGHRPGDLARPVRRVLGHFVRQPEVPRFAGTEDPPGEAPPPRAPRPPPPPSRRRPAAPPPGGAEAPRGGRNPPPPPPPRAPRH